MDYSQKQVLISLLNKYIDNIKNDTCSVDETLSVLTLAYKSNLDTFSDEQVLKFAVLGWYITNLVDKTKIE